MAKEAIAILESGLVCSVGLNAPAAFAAIRAAITNHSETKFIGANGEWLIGAAAPLDTSWLGRTRLVKMLASAISECLNNLDPAQLPAVPLLLCVSEVDRPGRTEDLDNKLYEALQSELGWQFNKSHSLIIPQGRISAAIALAHARKLIYEHNIPFVLIAAVDSLLVAAALDEFEDSRRILTDKNSNGFIPGEAASAVLVGRSSKEGVGQLLCTGIGYALERATIHSEEPLRADGLSEAIKNALNEAACDMGDMDFRITDNSGEHYYFKEAALALTRTLRRRKETMDIWHPADCIGEVGAAIGPALLGLGLAAGRKAYALGNNMLCHMGNDSGQRAAIVLQYEQ
ncbi:MAG: hypothetical protein V4568_12030 [Pseudomonadota bacterium]